MTRLLEGGDREDMDRGMHMNDGAIKMPARQSDGTFVLHTVRPTDLRKHLAEAAVRTGAPSPFGDDAAIRFMSSRSGAGAAPLLEGDERDAMNRGMGIVAQAAPARLPDGRFSLPVMRPAEVRARYGGGRQ
ncbi:MAG TPA: hypothetical protein VK550_11155 [Polyangiaceae bacterium]|nr:hypothetical protein [Polyangiaceae bacterium]